MADFDCTFRSYKFSAATEKARQFFRQGDPRSQDRRRQLRPLCLTEKSKTYCQEQVNNLLHKIVDI